MSYFNQLPIEELETSIDQYPDEPEVRAALIKRLAAEGDIDAAISQAFIADELIPDNSEIKVLKAFCLLQSGEFENCLLYTSPSPRDQRGSRMPSSA